VLDEFVNAARRKLNRAGRKLAAGSASFGFSAQNPAPVTIETYDRAMQIAERYGYSMFDLLLVAAVLERNARPCIRKIGKRAG
jgi:predicted nucleic acid-binding protein